MGEKCTFGGRQKFLGDGVAGRSTNRPGANFGHVAHSTSRNFNFNEKQKNYASWKLCNAKKSKIMVAPPPFGTQCPYSPGLSWDEYRVCGGGGSPSHSSHSMAEIKNRVFCSGQFTRRNKKSCLSRENKNCLKKMCL